MRDVVFRYTVSADSASGDLEPVAMALHELVNHLPVTARSRERRGLRIEGGKVLDRDYSGPVLEQVIRENIMIHTTPAEGVYRGIPVIVAPVRDEKGGVLAALGVVDVTGVFDLARLMEHQAAIIRQVCGTDPCPLPGELVTGRR